MAHDWQKVGQRYGHKWTETRRAQPLFIHGVGQGSQRCDYEINLAAAIRIATPPTATGYSRQEPEQESAKLVRITSPICGGTGQDLPGLLGLRTIEANNGVIETAGGRAFMTFPGPGGYEIKWAPGAMHIPLEKAATGHLCVELDHYDKLPTDTGGVPEKVPTLFADGRSPMTPFENAASTANRTRATTREIGTQTDAKVMFADGQSTTLADTGLKRSRDSQPPDSNS